MKLSTISQATNTSSAPYCFARVGNLRLAYREGGTSGEPVILIHGLCSMIYTWREVFEPLAAQQRTIALDLKGSGASDKPAGDYRLDAQAEVVMGLMDALGVERAALVGNSMGGAVALRLAERWRDRVTRLVLADPAVYQAHARSRLARLLFGSSGTAGRMLASRVLQWLLRSPAFIESRMRVIYSRPSTITPERVAAYHAMLSDAACQRAVIATLQAWDLRPVERDLSRVRQPTLVIWGTRDRIIRPSFARRLVGDLPQAELRLLPCGHAPQEEMPKEFARLVTDFLQAAARE